MDSLIATARSNKEDTCLGIRDFNQLRKDYGREQADVIMNITGKSSSPGNRRKPKPNRDRKLGEGLEIELIKRKN